jgi:hypothetical protein
MEPIQTGGALHVSGQLSVASWKAGSILANSFTTMAETSPKSVGVKLGQMRRVVL